MSLPSQLPDLLAHSEFQEQAAALKGAASLSQMVCIVVQMGLFVARWVLEAELSRRAHEAVVWSKCSACGHRLHSKGWQSRQMQTLVREIH
jgi:hypothetical protein